MFKNSSIEERNNLYSLIVGALTGIIGVFVLGDVINDSQEMFTILPNDEKSSDWEISNFDEWGLKTLFAGSLAYTSAIGTNLLLKEFQKKKNS